MSEESFIDKYINYVRETEPPYVFHRWSILSSIGAILGRNYFLQFGHGRIYPNLYALLIGDAGSRKSTAIKISAKMVRNSGYTNFAANKTRLEKFLIDLEGVELDDADKKEGLDYDSATAQNLWGDIGLVDPREVFIAADEWTDFAPRGDIDFYTLLGTLWDWDDANLPYKHRLKNSRSVSVYQPTVSILGGITPEKFANAFPTEIIGGGFLSRMIIVHGERSERRYTIPPVPSEQSTNEIIAGLKSFRAATPTEATIEPGAFKVLDDIYRNWVEIDDVRFKSYSQRRFTQLLKLSLIVAASRRTTVITDEIVVIANTYLAAAETKMSAALGEFGKSRNSDISNKIMDILNKTSRPMNARAIWVHVVNDLEKMQSLYDIMQGLQVAERVQNIKDKGWLPLKKRSAKPEHVDWSFLTDEEKVML